MSVNDKSAPRLQLVTNNCDRTDCNHCQGEQLCLAFGLDRSTVDDFRSIIKEHGPYNAGDYIFREGQNFASLYSVQRGAIKTETVTQDGKQAVMGFYLAGDLLGADAIVLGHYPADAIALDTTVLCEIPYRPLLKLCADHQELQNKFINRLSSKIHSEEYSWKMMRNEPAPKRIMFFLYQLYERQRRYSRSSPRLQLPMSKQDLASFLGLTPEAFSRTLRQLQDEQLIRKDSQRVLELLHPPVDREISIHTLPEMG